MLSHVSVAKDKQLPRRAVICEPMVPVDCWVGNRKPTTVNPGEIGPHVQIWQTLAGNTGLGPSWPSAGLTYQRSGSSLLKSSLEADLLSELCTPTPFNVRHAEHVSAWDPWIQPGWSRHHSMGVWACIDPVSPARRHRGSEADDYVLITDGLRDLFGGKTTES